VSLPQGISLERDRSFRQALWGTSALLVIAIVGLFIVKWSPYWHKAHVAATAHSIGKSIVSGTGLQPEAVGLHAGWTYTIAYFTSVWQAVVLALLLGASVQTFLPRAWLLKLFGKPSNGSAAIAAATSVTTMMCTCCTAPIVVGLRRQRAAAGSALAFFLGNPVLNPATIIFIGFVLGWAFAGLRIAVGLVLVFAVATIANRLSKDDPSENFTVPLSPIEDGPRTAGATFRAWLRELWIEIYTLLPGYIAIVFVVGSLRAWLFPPGLEIHASGIVAVTLLSAIGTIFVIPTAGEVPIVQTLVHAGMGAGPAAALLMTLPAISAPSLFIVRKVFSPRVLAWTTACVFAAGLLAGAIAMLMLRGR
jgi:uncharacterized protein